MEAGLTEQQKKWFASVREGLVRDNRAAAVLDAAFPGQIGWDRPEAMVAALWKTPADLKIHDALVAVVSTFNGAIVGERKTFTAFSRKYQFAAARPTKEGVRPLGAPAFQFERLARLGRRKPNEGWSDRCTASAVLTSTKDIDAELKKLLKIAFAAP